MIDGPTAGPNWEQAYGLKHQVFAGHRALSGKQLNPQLCTLIAICQALNVKIEDVVDYSPRHGRELVPGP